MVHRVSPHLLVLDIMLPGGMNGLDLCRLLKTSPALGLPAVVLVNRMVSCEILKRRLLLALMPIW